MAMMTMVMTATSCQYQHVYYPGNGPTANLFLGEYLVDGSHNFHQLNQPLPCPAEDLTAREIRTHWMDLAIAIELEVDPNDEYHTLVWDMREDCPWNGGLSRQLVVGDLVFARKISYVGWGRGVAEDQQVYIALHELQHQLKLQHCDLVDGDTPCIPPYEPNGQEITSF